MLDNFYQETDNRNGVNAVIAEQIVTYLGNSKSDCFTNIYQKFHEQTGADITGQLQVRPMLYTLYIDINLRVVKMLHTDNKQRITK